MCRKSEKLAKKDTKYDKVCEIRPKVKTRQNEKDKISKDILSFYNGRTSGNRH